MGLPQAGSPRSAIECRPPRHSRAPSLWGRGGPRHQRRAKAGLVKGEVSHVAGAGLGGVATPDRLAGRELFGRFGANSASGNQGMAQPSNHEGRERQISSSEDSGRVPGPGGTGGPRGGQVHQQKVMP